MKVNEIKELLKKSKGENKINTLIAITKLIESYRSVFVGSQSAELSFPEYDLLKSFMVESLDYISNDEGEIQQFFCVPIILDDALSNISNFKLPKHKSEIQASYINHLIDQPESDKAGVTMGCYIVSRRTLFGGNIFNTFDTVRALTNEGNGYLNDDVVLNECDDEHLFYLVGKYSSDVSDPFINEGAYEDFLAQLDLSRYFPYSSLSVGIPVLLSKEYCNSMVCDIAIRVEKILVGELGFDESLSNQELGLNLQTVKLKLDKTLLSGQVELYADKWNKPFVVIDLARIPDVNQVGVITLASSIMSALKVYRFKYFKYSLVDNNIDGDGDGEQCQFIRPYDKQIKNKIMSVI